MSSPIPHPPSPSVIVTPVLAAANLGNGLAARRWSRLLAEAYSVRPTDTCDEAPMIALCARRSAASLQR